MNRIEFDSIWWKHSWYEFGASYRETTYCVLSMFFFRSEQCIDMPFSGDAAIIDV